MSLTTKQLSTAHLSIGKLVRDLRQVMNLPQEKFAAEFSMSFLTINRWEDEHAVRSPLALKQIEGLLQQLGDRGEALRTQSISEDQSPS